MPDDTTESPSTPSTSDGYTAQEAARLLGVSPRRVRQLLDAGTLSAAAGDRPEGAPVILDRESVHRERESRRASRKGAGKPEDPTSGGLSTGDLMDLFERMQDRTLETLRRERAEVLAIRDRTEQDLRDALAAERAAREMAATEAGRLSGEVEELREEAARLRAQVEELTAPPPVVEPAPAPVEKRRRWWHL